MTLYSNEESEEILTFSRDVLNSFVNGEDQIMPREKIFIESRGVKIDVDLESNHFSEIIQPEADISLAENIVSVIGAIYDKVKEVSIDLDDVELRITIFSNPVEIKEIKEFKLDEGLMCDYIGYKGILFPNKIYVDKVRFLEALCREANLSKDAWQNQNMKFYSFRAQEIGRIV